MPGWMVCGRHSSAGGKAGADALFQHARKPGDPMGQVFTTCDFFSPLRATLSPPVFYLLTLAALKVLRAQIIDAEPVTV